MAERWLSCKELADRWRVAPTTIQRWGREGKLPGVRLANGHYRFRPSDADAFEASQLPVPASYTCEDLAERWGVTRRAVARWKTTGRLKGHTIHDGSYRFRVKDVAAFEAQGPVEEDEPEPAL